MNEYEEDLKLLCKAMGIKEDSWSGVFFRCGYMYAHHLKSGGTKTDREFIIDYMAENYDVPKRKPAGKIPTEAYR